ncbi:diaminopimelate decarboxylase [Streptomyces sp. GXMU-J5]|uniref:Diaminopimelate decarboxylase n=1 Tax=Streptomyces beihaiensis TaxID=2984495 RepID=A0ABT3TN39_9ACTN|nr:diaminopimelate decarboxylase [Streptomyces beihaiensis]MCX3058459.1 diaminopimelate decarboxylase [Streptomyces beihaiensis]
MSAASVARRDAAVRAAVTQGLVGPDAPVAGLLDVAGVRAAARALHAAFAVPGVEVDVRHTFAVKAASLVPVLALLDSEGIGAEVASAGELELARAAGVPAARTVFDAPAKTPAELRDALAHGVAVNADNPQELDRIDALVDELGPGCAPLGLRVNPQLGAGAIGAVSTATPTSKFGVGLRDEGAEQWVLDAFRRRPWLTRLHSHTGSQGMAMEQLAEGVRVAYELAEKINAHVGRRQVDTVDIGGGLSVNFGSDETTPTYEDYARVLREAVPGLFDGRYAIVTEFGRSLLAEQGVIVARVEYTKTSGGRRIALTHAGAQVATRTVFVPEAWPLRVAAFDGQGRPKDSVSLVQDVAGPCCFAGDLVARGRELPELAPGDFVALLDTGAYYFSTAFQYNSLPRPGVYGYVVSDTSDVSGVSEVSDISEVSGVSGVSDVSEVSGVLEVSDVSDVLDVSDVGSGGSGVTFVPVRGAQTIAEVVAESGGGEGQRAALTGL